MKIDKDVMMVRGKVGKRVVFFHPFICKGEKMEAVVAEHWYNYESMLKKDIDWREEQMADSLKQKVKEYKNSSK